MNIEDRIAALSQRRDASPFCWLICFEKRPLQGIPPGGSGAHLMAFSSEMAAHAFISGRRKYYGSEPLSAIKIDSAESLKALLEEPSLDPRYAPPPCGLAIDFDYSSGNTRRVLSASQASGMSVAEIAAAFQAAPPIPGALPPTIPQLGKGGWSTTTKRIAMGIGGLAIVAILFFGIRAVYGGMKSGKIPAFGLLNTPTSDSHRHPNPHRHSDDHANRKTMGDPLHRCFCDQPMGLAAKGGPIVRGMRNGKHVYRQRQSLLEGGCQFGLYLVGIPQLCTDEGIRPQHGYGATARFEQRRHGTGICIERFFVSTLFPNRSL